MKDDKQQFHFYAVSCLNWNTNADLLKVLLAQRKADKPRGGGYQTGGCTVYKVPLPADAHYSIDNYVPEVDGIERIADITY